MPVLCQVTLTATFEKSFQIYLTKCSSISYNFGVMTYTYIGHFLQNQTHNNFPLIYTNLLEFWIEDIIHSLVITVKHNSSQELVRDEREVFVARWESSLFLFIAKHDNSTNDGIPFPEATTPDVTMTTVLWPYWSFANYR